MGLLLFCALSIFAAHETSQLEIPHRALTHEEARAMRAIWDTSNMDELLAIAHNPQQHWENRKKDLLEKGATMSHNEFCRQYTADAKKRLQINAAQRERWGDAILWLHEPDVLEGLLKPFVPESHDMFADTLCYFYARACDYALKEEEKIPMRTAEDTRKFMQKMALEMAESYEKKFLGRVRWSFLPDGKFSLFDSLVMRSCGYYYCSAPSDYTQRDLFLSHMGFFSGWFGIRWHDLNTHSLLIYDIDNELSKFGVTEKDYFAGCINPGALAPGNIITLSHQILANFYQFHEYPATKRAFKDRSLFDLLFPSLDTIIDEGFRDIVPYLMEVPLEHDLSTTPLKRVRANDKDINDALEAWRHLYCYNNIRFVREEDFPKYLESLDILRHMPSTDIERSPHFVDTVLHHLTGTTEPDIIQKAKLLTENILCKLESLAQSKPAAYKLHAAPEQIFLLRTTYKERLHNIPCFLHCKILATKARDTFQIRLY